MMPAHEGLVIRMLDAMGADMRGKNMQAHAARMQRVMAMHEGMMRM